MEGVGGQVTRVLKHEQEFSRRGVGWESESWPWGQCVTEPGGGSENPVVPSGHWHAQSCEGS